ncbi:MAG: glycosyltransferase family 39 protein [Anaerolineae bacterium]|nr:glycosyltransferase family 39 protein [Anaerolineae bacterium]
MTTRIRFLIITVFLLLVAAGLRTWQLDTQSLWFDEGFSWHAATQPTLAAVLDGDPTNPPLYYLLLHIWIRLVGDSEFSLRALSLMQGVVLLAGLGALARRWFGSRTALTAIGLGAFTPLLWWAAQEARMYNTLALGVLLLAAGYLDLLRHPDRRQSWAALAAGELITLYAHNTGIVVLGAINLVFALGWALELRRGSPDWRLLGRWVISQIVVAGLWLPELLARFRNLGSANAALRTPPDLSPQLLWQSWQAVWASSWEMVLDNPPVLQISAGLMLALLLIGLAALRRPAGRRLWGLLAALYGILLAALVVLGVNFHARYLVFLAPVLVIILAAGLNEITSQRGRRLASAAGICTAAIIWVILPGQPDIAYQHDQAREITRYYVDNLGEDDLVLTWSYAQRYELQYYAEKMDLRAQLVTLPEAAELSEVLARLNAIIPADKPIRAEINTWYTQASDRRGMLPCVIGHNNPAPSAPFTVQGMTTRGYTIQQPLSLPETQPLSGDFGALQITGIGTPSQPMPVHRGICLPVDITLSVTTTEAFRIAANLLNPAGMEIAGADAPLLTAAQQPTSQLAPGDRASAFLLLYLPQGAPPGSYPAFVRIYSAARPAGLDLRDPVSGAPQGKDLAIGEITVSAGAWLAFSGDCSQPLASSVTLTNCAALEDGALLQAGESLALTLALQVEPGARQLTLTLESDPDSSGEPWQINAISRLDTASGAFLAWPLLRIPANAEGAAQLIAQVDDHPHVVLAQYTVEHAEHVMSPPAIQSRSGVSFEEAGLLYGFSVEESILRSGMPFDITLVWQAEEATARPYAVTVQLLNHEGILLAQHDSQPAGGSRPTTGWVPQEYIEDSHRLEFREEYAAYTGAARLIVALYDPETGTRLLTQSGADHLTLPVELEITDR